MATTEVIVDSQRGRRRRRVRRVVIAAVCVLLVALAYLHFFLYLPAGTGPAGSHVDRVVFAHPWSERQVVLVGIGDSVTAGFGATKGHSYFDRLITNPPDELGDMQGVSLARTIPNLRAINLAVSGSNSLQHLAHVRDRLPRQADDVFGLVVMTTGGNDLIHWYGTSPPREAAMYGATLSQAEPWIANYETRLDAIFTAIAERFPGGCLIFVADIYDPSDGVGDPESTWALPRWPDCLKIVTAYNATLRRVASQHSSVRVVPVHDAFLGHGIHCRQFWRQHYDWHDPHYWYFENIEDPNDRGYDALRRIFLREITSERKAIASAPRRQQN